MLPPKSKKFDVIPQPPLVSALRLWTAMAPPKVVIVGAGPGGLACAKALKGRADVTIVEA